MASSKHRWVIVLVLLIAALLRWIDLDRPGYNLDELWTAEVATGRASLHLHLPTDRIMPAPEFFSLQTAPPWTAVWTHMEVTHPPLYYLALRGWMQLLGQSDFNERSLAAICSLVALLLLYDSAKRLNGPAVAFWAALLMAVACPQVDFARKTRNYGMVFLTVMIAVNAVIRIEQLGINRKRWAALFLGALATPLTHYFGTGAIVGLAIYTGWAFHGKKRLVTLAAFALAALVFTASWGPFFIHQLPLFSLHDPGVSFARDDQPGHTWRVLVLLSMAPITTLVDRIHLNQSARFSAVLLILPLLLHRRKPGLLLWGLLLCGTLGVITLLDLSRHSLHLGFSRYVALAGLPVFVLIPALLTLPRVPRCLFHAMPAAAVLMCICFLRDSYVAPAADPNDIAALLRSQVTAQDVIVFVSTGELSWTRGIQAMLVTRYDHPLPCPILLLDGPPSPATLKTLQHARAVFAFSSALDITMVLPGFTVQSQQPMQFWGDIAILVPKENKRGLVPPP